MFHVNLTLLKPFWSVALFMSNTST